MALLPAVAAGLAATAASAQLALPGACPPVLATADVGAGMTGIGLTVTSGTEPEEFTAEVLGVLENGIGPGRHLILASLAGPPIEAAGGGIAFGYSGSPVYLEDGGVVKLAGAVAYGLSWGPSSVAGLTPAEDMNDLFDLAGASAAAPADPARVALGRAERTALARALGTSAAQVGDALLRLETPLAVAGATEHAMGRVRAAIARQGLPFVPYAAGMTAATEPAAQPVEAGRSFAAALSYGDVGFAAVGTTTAVCDGKAVAFGHPFGWEGEATYGANAAETITIVPDSIGGSYKLAQIGGLYGTVDQDRLAGIRAVLGDGPGTTPIVSTVTSLGTGRTRTGSTGSVLPEFVPFLTFVHLLSNIDVTIDRTGEGSSLLRWVLSGTDASGEPWTLTRSNRHSSNWDIATESVLEISSYLDAIVYNPYEDVEVTGVEMARADVADRARSYSLQRLLVSRNGRRYAATNVVVVHPRDTIHLLALLKPNDGAALHVVELRLRVPRFPRPARGFVEVGSGFGGGFEPCFLGDCDEEFPEEGREAADGSFAELLEALGAAPRNHALRAQLFLGGELRRGDRSVLDRVVSGGGFVRVVVRRR